MYTITDKKSAIKSVQKMMTLIYPDKMIVENGVYDLKTKDAVLALQRSRGIADTGNVDMETFYEIRNEYFKSGKKNTAESINLNIDFPVKKGYVSEFMPEINMKLGRMLEYYGEVDRIRYNRIFSYRTAEAVKILRVIYGLDLKDEIDAEFLYILFSDYDAALRYSELYSV